AGAWRGDLGGARWPWRGERGVRIGAGGGRAQFVTAGGLCRRRASRLRADERGARLTGGLCGGAHSIGGVRGGGAGVLWRRRCWAGAVAGDARWLRTTRGAGERRDCGGRALPHGRSADDRLPRALAIGGSGRRRRLVV